LAKGNVFVLAGNLAVATVMGLSGCDCPLTGLHVPGGKKNNSLIPIPFSLVPGLAKLFE
jgi:hypothetical protein